MGSPLSTRDKLLDAATRLYAARGVNNVSLNEIVRSAGQRNASALHYHVGGRNDVLAAILDRHVPVIRDRRLELLEAARATPADDQRSVVEAMVRPVTEFARRGWRERAYLQIGAELAAEEDRTTPEIRKALRATAGGRVMALLAERSQPIAADLWVERASICYGALGRAAADRARQLDRNRRRGEPALSDDRFVDNLIDMFLGAMTAPQTDATGHRST
jgi:AcrR family transcriptional regulator